MNARHAAPQHEQGSPAARQPGLFDAEPWSRDVAPSVGDAKSESPPGRHVRGQLADQQSQHLQAARRLSKAIRGQRADRKQQTKTGKAICEHLLALLAANESAADSPAYDCQADD